MHAFSRDTSDARLTIFNTFDAALMAAHAAARRRHLKRSKPVRSKRQRVRGESARHASFRDDGPSSTDAATLRARARNTARAGEQIYRADAPARCITFWRHILKSASTELSAQMSFSDSCQSKAAMPKGVGRSPSSDDIHAAHEGRSLFYFHAPANFARNAHVNTMPGRFLTR